MHLLSNDAATPTTRIVRVALDGAPFPYRAGQAASVGLDSEQLTPYSIASAPHETAERGYLEFLVKVDGSTRFGSQVSHLKTGTPLVVTPASGRFGLPADAGKHPLLFIAGGTGIAPLRSMLRHVIDEGRSGSKALVYSARIPDEFAYVDELRTMNDAGQLDLTLTLTGEARDWRYARGRAGPEHLAERAAAHTLCFICGPPSMVNDVPAALIALGVPREHIKTEEW